MDASFWHEKWTRGEIGFHQSEINRHLSTHFDKLDLVTGARVFVPLCGKTLDIAWLLERGYRVVGVELSTLAVDALFLDLGLRPTVVADGGLAHYRADRIEIFVGDIFSLSRDRIGAIDAIYDRAALVALPENLRARYATHLKELGALAPQLLVCFVYDQKRMDGPPFSVSDDEVHRHYGACYELELIERAQVSGKLKDGATQEHVWLLRTRASRPASSITP